MGFGQSLRHFIKKCVNVYFVHYHSHEKYRETRNREVRYNTFSKSNMNEVFIILSRTVLPSMPVCECVCMFMINSFQINICFVFQHATTILNTFQGIKLDYVSSNDNSINLGYFAKYLTSQKLLDLQLHDVNFRRSVLLQFLIVFQYFTSAVKFKS